MKDSQKVGLYNAEKSFRFLLDNTYNAPKLEVYGSAVYLSEDRKFEELSSIQNYVDRLTKLNWVEKQWPSLKGYKVTVRPRKGSRFAHYESLGSVIAIPDRSVGGKWAMREIVVLHEIAHHLSKFEKGESHGEVFAGVFLKLIEEILSPEDAFVLKYLFHENDVRFLDL